LTCLFDITCVFVFCCGVYRVSIYTSIKKKSVAVIKENEKKEKKKKSKIKLKIYKKQKKTS
ncbi:hypothetical protein, partial [Petrotoga halophila]|uniref:hypothetical protein n=1 Tax=Petrotoga halophila TaxID=301141 RepID=UPI001B80240C